jgi:hypothetical protein
VKTQYLRLDDNASALLYLHGGVALENLFHGPGGIFANCLSVVVESVQSPRWGLCFSISLFYMTSKRARAMHVSVVHLQ